MSVDQQKRIEEILSTIEAERKIASALLTWLTARPYAQRLALVLSMLNTTNDDLTDASIMKAIPPENMESWVDAAEGVLRAAIGIRSSVQELAERLGPNGQFIEPR